MKHQEARARHVDILLVCGAEDNSMRQGRVNHAINLIEEISRMRRDHLPVLTTGDHYILRAPILLEPMAKVMAHELKELGLQEKEIYSEMHSVDTIGNIYFSWELLEALGARHIGLVTDEYHMARAEYLANRILGAKYTITPLPVERNNGRNSLLEKVSLAAVKMDFTLYDVKPGDLNSMQRYMNEVHPHHTIKQNPRHSCYGFLVKIGKKMEKRNMVF